ncbi:hypothetical protein E0H26_26690, partial [Micromonospora zingiberis]
PRATRAAAPFPYATLFHSGPAARRPGGPAARRPGGAAARRPAARQANSPAGQRSGRAVNLTETANKAQVSSLP